ncbi:hypothetical protein [Pseudonocardia cypriaca]|uniref:hypothetical protein n=1 Tax=Pseudonocardia cypriaca TaxID=882449 RepID=UPI001B8785B0|nr:hypothetical protein [Pseudonocardia cypriaca]
MVTAVGLNNIWVEHLRSMARPAGRANRSALPIAGDDAAAKEAVTELLDSLGFDAVDAGPLAENWRTQRDTPNYVAPYGAYQASGPLPGTPANARVVHEALAAAKPTAP